MTQEEIINGNKLIAEFMGYVIDGERCVGVLGVAWFNISELTYHKNWLRLMDVIQTIEDTGDDCISVIITRGYCKIERIRQDKTITFKTIAQAESKIEMVYMAVLDFINWYNQHTR